jgi:(R,R)-butanediol dehydrogenase / meso-butanediol dehydrogenase / diacetyl reductase
VKAAVFHDRRDVRIESRGRPGRPGDDEVVLDVVRAAICGTDAAEFDRGPEMVSLDQPHFGSGLSGPVVLGHEFVGVVREVGAEVEGLTVGERVVPGATQWCGECVWCRSGRTNLCDRRYLIGMHRDGGLAEAATVPAKMCRPVPGSCSDDAAAIAQPLSVALHGIERGQVGSEPVVVIGAGGIGAFLIAAAKAAGASPLIVIDVAEARLSNAIGLGADHGFFADDPQLREKIYELTDGDGPPVVIEASGAPTSPALACELLRPGGRLLLMGMQAAPREMNLFEMAQVEIDMICSNAHICDRNLEPAIALLTESNLAETVIGDRIPLDDLVSKGLIPLVEGTAIGKIVVDPQV